MITTKLKGYFLGSNYYGKLIILIGLLIAVPILVLPFYTEEISYASSFLIPAGISIILGIAICIIAPNQNDKITEWKSSFQKSSIPVLFTWCYGILLGALPFYISNKLDFVHSLFESANGWTTTGFSLVDVTRIPHVFLFHRSFMQYCGGLGFIMMIVMIIKGKQAMSLYNAEGHHDKLVPNLKKTAQTIFLIYNGFLLIGAFLYCIFGMNLFDAICHSMSALSTAGFTTQTGSIGEYNSLPIEIITMFLMIIGSTNFAVLLLLVKGKIRQIFRVSEVRFMLGLLGICIPLCTLALILEMNMGILESLRNASFAVISSFSTTGYSISDLMHWPAFAIGILMILAFIGGGTGSTSGGIKLSRASLLLLITRESIRKRMSPARNVRQLKYYRAQGKTIIDNTIIIDTFGFIASYVGILIIGSLLITITADCTLSEAILEFVSVFTTLGITNGITNADTNTATLIVEMIGMLLGRLEIFIVFIGLHSFFNEIKSKLSKIANRIKLLLKPDDV